MQVKSTSIIIAVLLATSPIPNSPNEVKDRLWIESKSEILFQVVDILEIGPIFIILYVKGIQISQDFRLSGFQNSIKGIITTKYVLLPKIKYNKISLELASNHKENTAAPNK